MEREKEEAVDDEAAVADGRGEAGTAGRAVAGADMTTEAVSSEGAAVLVGVEEAAAEEEEGLAEAERVDCARAAVSALVEVEVG